MKIIQNYLPTNQALLTCYLPDPVIEMGPDIERPAVLIFPGGAYHNCAARECEPVAMAYVSRGFAAFTLIYTTSAKTAPEKLFKVFDMAFADAQEAYAYVLSHASKFSINPKQIAAVGFSAGGNLAAALGTMGEKRPSALVLGYPSVDGQINEQLGIKAPVMLEQVDGKTPPTFIWTTQGDTVVKSANTLLWSLELAKRGIPYETHVFVTGDHGLSIATDYGIGDRGPTDPDVAQWVDLSVRFLKHIFSGERLVVLQGSCERYGIDMRIDQILDDERAAAIFRKFLPGLEKHLPEQAMGLSIRKLAAYGKGMISEEMLEKMEEELQGLNDSKE